MADLLQATNELYGDCYQVGNTIYIGTIPNGLKATASQMKRIKSKTISNLLEQKKEEKKEEIKKAYKEDSYSDISYMDTIFQANEYSQDLIVSTLSAGTVPDGFFWVDAFNNEVPMTFSDLQGLSWEIINRRQNNFKKYQLLKAKIAKATTQEDLDNITWE